MKGWLLELRELILRLSDRLVLAVDVGMSRRGAETQSFFED